MPSALPEGDPAPSDGSLPDSALAELGQRPFGVYVHVPFCTVRCGYCDFNTYTVADLGTATGVPGASRTTYAGAAVEEVRLARRVLGEPAPVETVFFGGGTPTLLSPADLGAVLAAIDAELGLAPGAEVTTEANPDSVTKADLVALREAGFTRISFGMQSAVDHVLTVLDRTHDPARVPDVVAWARSAGLRAGQPGPDLRHAGGVAGRLGGLPRRRAGVRARPRLGVLPDRRGRDRPGPAGPPRRAADARRGRPRGQVRPRRRAALARRDCGWYEVSNWARDEDARCRHNLLYWTGADWWGVGPGAHSHVGGVRWWNVRHPAAYADRIAGGVSPAHGRELLDDETRRVERVLLELRLRSGLPLAALDEAGRAAVDEPGRSRAGHGRGRPAGAHRVGAGSWPTPWSGTCCLSDLTRP